MKKAGLFLLILFLSCNFAWSQDTLYIYRAGIVVEKKALNEVDSITFSENYNLPIQQTVTDIDGNIYHTVKIGTQTWMVENLKTTKYRNGDPISNITDNNAWVSSYNGAYCWYNNDIQNKDTLGGYAIYDSRNIAPIGWHVPSKEEWVVLINYLGGENVAGGKMKEKGTTHWISPNVDASNESGFNALPGGYRAKDTGTFQYKGSNAFYRTSSEEIASGYDSSWHIMLFNQNANITPSYAVKAYGFSVRCLKDSQTLPALTTAAISAITDTTAFSGGNITSDGGAAITARGICWSTSQNPTIEGYKTISDSTGIGAFTSKIKGLTADSTYYVRAYATNSVGTAYGEQVSFKTSKAVLQTVTDIDGNVYHTLKIGNQIWMVENLKTSKYRNGESITNFTDATSWSNTTIGAWCDNNNSTTNATKYGHLYNWYAVNDNRKIAPIGWHIPTDEELTILINYISEHSANSTNVVKAMATNSDWKIDSSVTGSVGNNLSINNSSGFSALPGGHCDGSGTFYGLTSVGNWWTSSINSALDAKYFYISYNSNTLNRTSIFMHYGLSVRCIKD